MQLLNVYQPDLRYEGVWLLANIATDLIKVRDFVADNGLIPYIIKMLLEIKDPVKEENLVWAATTICKGSYLPHFDKIKDALPLFCNLLRIIGPGS